MGLWTGVIKKINMQKLTNIIIVIAISILVHFGFTVVAPRATGHVGDANQYTMYAPANNTNAWCSNGASSVALGTSTSRSYLRISNAATSSGASVWLSLGTPAATGTGILLTASSSVTFDANSLFAGAINCLGNGAAQGVSISEEK